MQHAWNNNEIYIKFWLGSMIGDHLGDLFKMGWY